MNHQHPFTRRICLLSLLLGATYSCGDSEGHSSSDLHRLAGDDTSNVVVSDTEEDNDLVDEEQDAGVEEASSTRPSLAGERVSEDTGATQSEEATWIDIDLGSLGLISPVDDEDTGLPQGQSICAYQAPRFVLEHPLSHVGQGAEQRRDHWLGETENAYHKDIAEIVHLGSPSSRQDALLKPDLEGVVLPTHVNDLPLFARATEWNEERCYELGPFGHEFGEPQQGGVLFNEIETYEMYRRLIKKTLWRAIDQRPNKRTIVGIRGAYPGSLQWHHNAPNQYNDSLILLWRDEQGNPYVREFPVNTDTGVYDFGIDSSSSLRPNRHYPYINGWHRDYNAIQINLPGYPVRDDTNNNGHWDSDRNGWLDGPEQGDDYNRLGSAHNIHAGNNNGPLEEVLINIASAGCQVIPGIENWFSFISSAWTGLGDEIDYYLIDARDISPRFWAHCEDTQGSHRCPHLIEGFPYTHSADTALSQERRYDQYNCSDANESGPEITYVMNLPHAGRLRATIVTTDDNIDPDIYLLEGDDPNACQARDHRSVETWLPAGRYVIIIDTWVNAEGEELVGSYTLNVDWAPED